MFQCVPDEVVIRFQVCIFDILNTAHLYNNIFADSCDSLSSLYLWHIKYSKMIQLHITMIVVIRFQVCIFDILNTAMFKAENGVFLLWFAFKFVSLTY